MQQKARQNPEKVEKHKSARRQRYQTLQIEKKKTTQENSINGSALTNSYCTNKKGRCYLLINRL